MKQIMKYIALAFVAAAVLASCHERYVTYSDAEYVMFADTMATYPVQQDVEWFNIPVVSTVTRDYDRTFGVEVIDKGNNATTGTAIDTCVVMDGQIEICFKVVRSIRPGSQTDVLLSGGIVCADQLIAFIAFKQFLNLVRNAVIKSPLSRLVGI
jgi:hypothetical protein